MDNGHIVTGDWIYPGGENCGDDRTVKANGKALALQSLS